MRKSRPLDRHSVSSFAACLSAVVLAVCGLSSPVLAQQCVGDADGDGIVRVNELVVAVNNALEGCETSSGTTAADVVRNYAELLFRNYTDAHAGAVQLQAAIEELVTNPKQVTLDAAKAAWLTARPSYQQSEVGRFYEGPIDNEENGPEGRINAWPLDEGFVDYVVGNAGAGIINMPAQFPALTREVLASQNELGGEDNIATGWHAIEFLLWGQDRSIDGPGMRPFTDYLTGAGATAANQDRRRQYLRIIATMLVDDLESVRAAWAPNRSDNYRAEFVRLDPKVALGRIITGVGTLSGSELSNERMAVALETQDQEDEHSCFSDNTHNDHRFDERGIQNVYLGRYGSLDGPGLDVLVHAVSPDLDVRMQAQLQATVDAIQRIPVPFDQAIKGADSSPGRQAIISALEALRAQTKILEEIAEALDLEISTGG